MIKIRLRSSPPGMCSRLAKYRKDNSHPGVLDRSEEETRQAAGQGALIHLETASGEIVGVGGIYDIEDDIYDIGGIRVTLNGRNLQKTMMQVSALAAHFAHGSYVAITGCVYFDNHRSIRNMEAAGFTLYHTAPATFAARRRAKAGPKPFRIYRADLGGLRLMARDLVALYESPIIKRPGLEDVELSLEHPLFDQWLRALVYLAAFEDDGSEGAK